MLGASDQKVNSSQQTNNTNQNVNVNINNEQITTSITPSPLPTPIKNNCDTDFPGQNWDTKYYTSFSKDGSSLYRPKPVDFFYPSMFYTKKVSGIVKSFYLQYATLSQDEESSESAALHFAIREGEQELFEINIPAYNRQIIEIKVKNNNDPLPTVIPAKSIVLPHRISPIGTHEITITTKEPIPSDGSITYIFDGAFVYSGGTERVEREITVNLLTSNPSEKDFTYEIGTIKQGILDIKNVSVCD